MLKWDINESDGVVMLSIINLTKFSFCEAVNKSRVGC
jgi:hypothetical protein